jgi:hypothetical protein
MVDLPQVAKAAKDFACTLYKNQPGALIPTPFSEVLHLVWDNFCSYPGNPGLPPPPASNFSGGQCDAVPYVIRVKGQLTESGQTYPSDLGNFIVFGPIGGVGVIGQSVVVYCRGVSGISGLQPIVGTHVLYSVTGGAGLQNFVITELRTQDNSPDTCGNPPSRFPPAPPPPPGGYNSPPVNFTFNDGSNININFNFSPPPPPPIPPFPTNPPPPPLIDKLPPIVINFNKPEFNLKIPIAFNFDGTINFGGSGGGDNDFNQDDRDSINDIKNVTNNTNNTTNNTNNNVDNFYGDYKKDRDRTINKEPLPDDFEPPKPPEPPGKKLVERLAYVNVELSVIPSNAKSQSGKGAPNVVYAGWFEFLRKDKSFPRDYIHFANNCFIAPVGADGYAFTLYNGYQGTAVAITFKE